MKGAVKLAGIGLALAMITMTWVIVAPQPVQATHVDNRIHGPYADRLVWSQQLDQDLALESIIAGDQDIFMFSLKGVPRKERAFDAAATISTFGSVNEMSMNANEMADGSINPFTSAKIREAMQWLMDRDFIVREIFGGFAEPFYGPFHPLDADVARESELFEELAEEYSADFLRAQGQILAAMRDEFNAQPGATPGTWVDVDAGTPVDVTELVIFARIEDERLDVGSYMATQLRSVGFAVDFRPVPALTAFGVVFGADPAQGDWHVYTGGWAFTAIVAWRDFQIWLFHYCGLSLDLYCEEQGGSLSLPAENVAKAEALAFGLYGSADERQELIRELAPLTYSEGNYRMWLTAEEAIFPVNPRLESFVWDTFGGPWGHHMMKSAKLAPGEPGVRDDGTGGTIRIANFLMFNDAWHPWVSPGWLYDSIQRRAIGDPGMWLDPSTGVGSHFRVDTTVETAGPVGGDNVLTVPETAQIWRVVRTNQPPTAFFGFDAFNETMVPTPLNETRGPIFFDGSASVDPDLGLGIENWTWDFGDGSPVAFGRVVNHTYAADGQFEVTLTVRDFESRGPFAVEQSDEAVMIWELPVNVTESLVASFTQPTLTILGAGGEVTVVFDGTGSFGFGLNVTSYAWDFGDETTDADLDAVDVRENGALVNKTYDAAGVFDVRLTVSNETSGFTANLTRQIHVLALPPAVVDEGWEDVGPAVTAASRVVTHLDPEWMDGMGRWHTGQDITMADVVYSMSNAYRRSFGDISLVDPTGATAATRAFLRDTLQGMVFDPDANTVTAWTQFWHPDELEIALNGYVYISDGQAPAPWEVMEVAVDTVLNDNTRFTAGRAAAIGVDTLDMGRSADVRTHLVASLTALRADQHVPLGMEDWISAEEATARYDALDAFRQQRGHFYPSNGPFVMTSIRPDILQTDMEAFRDGYPIAVGHWDDLVPREPPILRVVGDPPAIVNQFEEVRIQLSHRIAGELADPEETRWTLRDLTTGEILFRGVPVRTDLGQLEVVLPSRMTAVPGTFELTVASFVELRSGAAKHTFGILNVNDLILGILDTIDADMGALRDQADRLEATTGSIAAAQAGLTSLLIAVLALAVIAVVVPTTMTLLVLRRLPPPGGGSTPPPGGPEG